MKTTTFLTSALRNIAIFVIAGILTLSVSLAEVRTYRAKWSGATFGNNAMAVADIVIDEAVLSNPGDNDYIMDPSTPIRSITLTVSGASSGNGTFITEHFSEYQLGIVDQLNLDVEWVGQEQPLSFLQNPWGISSYGDIPDNRFSLGLTPAGILAGAPEGFDYTYDGEFGWYWLRTSNGSGDRMQLTSIKPLKTMTTSEPVANVPDTIVFAITPPAVASDGNLYLHGKLKGAGVTSANDLCLLKWDGETASVLVREGDSLAGGSILNFGSPVSKGANLFFQAKLLPGGTVTTANDEVLVRASTAGGGQAVIAREGSSAAGVGGFNYLKVTWMHPVGNGLFFGATIVNATDSTKKRTGVWFNDGTTTRLTAVTGGNLKVNGVIRTVKSISKPAASGAANIQTRVGNSDKITLLIKTTDNISALRDFMH